MIQELIGTNPVVQGALGAAIYGLIFFAENRLGDDPNSFSPVKLGSTVFFGGLFGAALGGLGLVPTYENIGFVLTSYAGTMALAEYSYKALASGERRQAERGIGLAFEEFIRTTFSLGTSKEGVTESVERGADDYGDLDEDEQREAWEGEYPDEDTMVQADDEPLGKDEYEGERRTRMGETEQGQEQERDANEGDTGALPPA